MTGKQLLVLMAVCAWAGGSFHHPYHDSSVGYYHDDYHSYYGYDYYGYPNYGLYGYGYYPNYGYGYYPDGFFYSPYSYSSGYSDGYPYYYRR